MGLYDTITCYYPVPNVDIPEEGVQLQTKSLGCCMDRYILRTDGRLYKVVELNPLRSGEDAQATELLLHSNGTLNACAFIPEGNDQRFVQYDIVFKDGVVVAVIPDAGEFRLLGVMTRGARL